MCKASRSVHEVHEEEDSMFLGSIAADDEPWMADIDINDQTVQFKIDTGADVTVIPYSVFQEIYKHKNPPTLQKPRKPLLGPGNSPLDVAGFVGMLLRKGKREMKEDVYVVRHLQKALLRRPASVTLKLVARLDNVTMDNLKTNYPRLCSGLGEVRQPYTIKLKPGA